jgi:pimeloyl-ACP methyl ester carboxylesterase
MDGTGQLIRPQLAGLRSIFDILCLAIPPDDLTGWDGLLEQAAHLISTEKQKFPLKPIYLCGESFGGCLALQLVAHYPHLCDRLILVNPASSAVRQPWTDWGASLTRWLPRPLYRFSTLGLLPLLISQQRVPIYSQEALLMAMQSVSPTSAGWRISMLNNFLLEKLPLKRIVQPVLILASGADRLLPSVAEARRLVSHLSHARSVWLPQSGHACLLESEVRLDRILRSADFISDLSNPILSHVN